MAFANLKKRFKNWDALLSAPIASVELAVYPSGFFHLKAKRIRRALAEIKKREGRLSLSRIGGMPLGEAKAYLTSLYGVGPKTAAIILMFCFNKPSLPVDTHVFRVSRRLGLVPEKSNPERAQEMLEGELDQADFFPFHLGIITHGRKICTARSPKCNSCILRKLCPCAKKFMRKEGRKKSNSGDWI